jgi:hypothetical protein
LQTAPGPSKTKRVNVTLPVPQKEPHSVYCRNFAKRVPRNNAQPEKARYVASRFLATVPFSLWLLTSFAGKVPTNSHGSLVVASVGAGGGGVVS